MTWPMVVPGTVTGKSIDEFVDELKSGSTIVGVAPAARIELLEFVRQASAPKPTCLARLFRGLRKR